VIASHYAHALAVYLPAHWPGGTLTQFVLAFVLIVVAVVTGAGVLGVLLGRFTEVTGLKPVDRSLGLLFGLARGVLLIVLIVAFAGLTELPHYPFWQNALLRPYAQRGVQLLKPLLPDALTAYIKI
jgi:membrane protein required for colicin V production